MNDNSLSRLEWLRWRQRMTEPLDKKERLLIKVMDRVMCLVGQEQVKEEFLAVIGRVEAGKARGEELEAADFDLLIVGKPGTGNSKDIRTISWLYAELLRCLSVISSKADVAFRTDSACACHESDEYFERPEYRGKPVIVRQSRHDSYHVFYEANDISPRRVTLLDYTDAELRDLFARILRRRKLQVEGLDRGPLLAFAREIGLRRTEHELGNIRLVFSELEQALRRQGTRLHKASTLNQGEEPLYNLLTHEDLFGAPPKQKLDCSDAWKELQGMVGMEILKTSVQGLQRTATVNYDRHLRSREPVTITLNKVILGPPGTGKSTASRLYGQVIADLRLVPKAEVLVKNPSDFIHTEEKVLIIDDFHMLHQQDGLHSGNAGTFCRAVVDTLVANISTAARRCIILVGYTDHMEELFRQTNPGLRRRFPLEQAFQFVDYDCVKRIFSATDEAKKVACDILTRARDRPNFGNGGDVETLLTRAKLSYSARAQDIIGDTDMCLEPRDFDPDYDRATRSSTPWDSMFAKMVGTEKLQGLLHSYKQIATGMRLANLDYRPHIPVSFVFKGPPGTGKTSTARIFGELFYDLAFLSTTEVIECSASDLVGKYMGHTGPKVVALLERALGKVLFVDEAYRLANWDGSFKSGQSSFAGEALGELVDAMTKPRYARKMVIILAGYTEEMDNLLKTNPGLRSRFPTAIEFPVMTPNNSLKYLGQRLSEVRIALPPPTEEGQVGWETTVLRLFGKLSDTKSWAHARDVNELASMLTGRVYQNYRTLGEVPTLSVDDLIATMNELLVLRETGFKRPVKAGQA
ncbi:hypothetical protein BDW74DRAFT_171425 [Aspergillus multicolor]|uniref:uncharacterized protein n=1 Tax=Aspergillus multicolor TaxID=41759 RepID=UPI003CCD42F4